MSGPFPERLSRFTPDAGALDPAAVLFAAGRRSARPNRGWVALAAALAGTQALSLALLLVHPAPPAGSGPGTVVHTPPPAAPVEPPPSRPPDSPGLWSARLDLIGSEPRERPPTDPVTFVDTDPPLRAFGPPPPSVLK